MEEDFHFTWSDQASTLKQSFSEFLEHEDFIDVTLATADGKVKGHKVVLSAGSALLKEILCFQSRTTGCASQQTVFFHEVKHSSLLRIITFLYEGHVEVPQTEVEDFIHLAQEFGVKGLIHDNIPFPSMEGGPSKMPKLEVNQEIEQVEEGADDVQGCEAGDGSCDDGPSVQIKMEEPSEKRQPDLNARPIIESKEKLREIIDKKVRVVGNGFLCLICGSTIKQNYNVKRHFLAKHYSEGKTYRCPSCEKMFHAKSGIMNHISSSHREWSGQIDVNDFVVEAEP